MANENEQIVLVLLLDSGASISALPKSDAEALGIRAEDDMPFAITGIDGEVICGWKHIVAVTLQDHQHNISIAFLDNHNVPRVLGREGIFDRFTIVFEEHNQRSALLKVQSTESCSIGKIVDSTQGLSPNS